MSEHGVPIGPGPWQPTPGFFSSPLADRVRAHGLVLEPLELELVVEQ